MLKHFEGKLEGDENIGITVNGERYFVTTKELLANCIDAEYGKRLEMMMKALEKHVKNITEKPRKKSGEK